MLTKKEAKRLCVAEYGNIWGKDWVEQRLKSIGDTTFHENRDGFFKYEIVQYDSLLEPFDGVIKIGGYKKPDHATLFEVNLQTGEIEVLEHY